ncbi:MAG: hypothetical protein A2X45_05600 [Lentisphaerae bacterium GWF2_50_93]|nr:MAG: hypothetical protein A2X45_05600 [Lentisphaerae bacterium GWF2_50_93]
MLILISCSSAYFCRAEEPAGKNIRFGIVTDPHYADADANGTRFYRESTSKMAECVEKMNQEKVSFLVELGDFKDQGKPASEEKTLAFLKTIEAEFAKFAGPRYHVLGNHDQDSISKKLFLDNVENTGIPKDKSYYSFIKEGIQFIVLDANFKKDGTPYDHGNFDWKDANVPQEELDWLKKTLSDHDGKSIVFIHQRLDSDGDECVRNSPEIRKALSDSGKVTAVFNGHAHNGGLKKIDGISYYTLKAMIEKSGPENNSYAIVEVNKDATLKVIGFRKAASADLK